MNVIQTEGLTKIYTHDFLTTEHGRLKIHLTHRKTIALEDLSFEVNEGEIFGLLGPNGAGKTTTLKILMGIHYATRGKAYIMSKPLGDKHVKSQIGFLPENPYFYDYLTGREFLHFYGKLYRMNKADINSRMEKVMSMVNIAHAADLPLRGYSKGMLQRIGLAQALLNDPKVVFLDEPQSGLDPLGRKEIRDVILKLRDEGKTVLFSSHILSDAELICDRVGILLKGRLKSIGNLNDLLSAKVKEYEVVAKNLKSDLIEKISKVSTKVLKSKDEDLFIIKEESDAASSVKDIIESGGTLISFSPKKETLEEYFVNQVGG